MIATLISFIMARLLDSVANEAREVSEETAFIIYAVSAASGETLANCFFQTVIYNDSVIHSGGWQVGMKKTGSLLLFSLFLISMVVITTGTTFFSAVNVDEEKPYFEAKPSPVDEKVCPNRKVIMLYHLIFHGIDYEKELKRQHSTPLPSLTHPTIKVTATNGTISGVKDLAETYKDEPTYDEVFKSWNDTFDFTPKKPGSAVVKLEAHYLGMVTRTQWDIRVWEDCKYTVEVSADESSFKMPSGKTINEEQNNWSIRMFLLGKAKGVLADKLMNENGGGGQKRVLPGLIPLHPARDDVEGTLETFADGIWLGNAEDTTCGTDGAFTCNEPFGVTAEYGDETIKFNIDVRSGQCSAFHIWCRSEGGGGDANLPPRSSKAFQFSVEIPVEGGSGHYIEPLPHGTSMEYLVSAYPEVEE